MVRHARTRTRARVPPRAPPARDALGFVFGILAAAMGAPPRRRIRRLDRLAHLVPLCRQSVPPAGSHGDRARSTWCSSACFDEEVELQRLFGPSARCDAPLMATGGGRRYCGVDLTPALTSDQARFVVNALAKHRLVCFAGQNLDTFSLTHFERLASHFGAVVPHPNNYSTGTPGTYADRDGSIELMPVGDRLAARVNETFPGQLQAMPHTSPAVLTVSNFSGPQKPAGTPVVPPSIGGGFHSDIEYERLPIYVSMFLVQAAPTARTATGATWVSDPGTGGAVSEFEESSRFYRHNRPLTHELHRCASCS
jgi:alpha-ketoglutarate-dependent taurine dioxygenase